MHMARIGYCRTRKELRLIVKKVLDKDGRENPFKNNMPGQSWMRSFLRRHPKISIRQSSSLPYSRAKGCTKEILDEWYEPCDVGLFRPLKNAWNTQVNQHVCNGLQINKYNFANIYRQAWMEAVKPVTIINSFKRAGICPLDRGAVPEEKIMPGSNFEVRY